MSSTFSGAGPSAPNAGLEWSKQLISALRRRRRLFLTVALSVLALNVFVLAIVDRVYTAEAVVQVDNRQKLIEGSSIVAPLSLEEGSIKSEIDRLQSPATALTVIEQLDLLREPEFAQLSEHPFSAWIRTNLRNLRVWLGYQGADGPGGEWLREPTDEHKQRLFRADAVALFLDRLTVSNEARTRTLRVSYNSMNPELAARVANAVADFYIQSEFESKRHAAKIADEWLSKEVTSLRANVQEAERRLANFRAEHELGSLDLPSPTNQQLAEINEELILAVAAHAQAASRYARARRASAAGELGSIRDALEARTIQNLKQRRSEANRRIAQLRQRYGEQHVSLIAARAELANVEVKIDDELQGILGALRSEVDIAAARRNSLQAAFDKLQQVVAKKDHAQVQLRAYEREADASRALLNAVMQRSKELQAERGLQRPSIELVSAALVPVSPSSPRTGVVLMVGVFCAVLAGLSSVMAADFFRQTVRTISQGERLLGAPGLGWIPLAKGRKSRAVHRLTVDRPFGAYSESIRSLAASLSLRQARPGSILLVASAAPEEGKTTFALSYAQSLAVARQSCLVIDADLRRPAVVRRMQGEPCFGLADVAAGRISIWDAIERDKKTGLHYLGAGICDCDPLELFSSASLQILLRTVAARFEHVILDAPPLFAVSDAVLLARYCDAAVLVVKWDHTPVRLAQKSVRQLQAAGVSDISFVLSQVEVRRLSRLDDERYNAKYLRKYDEGSGPGRDLIELKRGDGFSDVPHAAR